MNVGRKRWRYTGTISGSPLGSTEVVVPLLSEAAAVDNAAAAATDDDVVVVESSAVVVAGGFLSLSAIEDSGLTAPSRFTDTIHSPVQYVKTVNFITV